MTTYITRGGDYGDVNYTGVDPSIFQNDVALRVIAPDDQTVRFGSVTISDCGMPLRHDSGWLEFHTLTCKRFTADLWNSIGKLKIENLIVHYDNSDYEYSDELHVDALGQFFSNVSDVVEYVDIENITAVISGATVQGMMLSEGNIYRYFKVGYGIVNIKIEYEWAFVANTLESSYVNMGGAAIKVKDVKFSGHPIRNNTLVESTMKLAIIIGHNSKSKGKFAGGTNEFDFWTKFFDENLAMFQRSSNIDLQVFNRVGGQSYVDQMRQVHREVDQWGADVSVEVHYNASGSSAKGHEVLYYNKSTGGRIVASVFDDALDMHLATRDRGLKPRGYGSRGVFGLKVGKSKSIIVEPFFAKEIESFMADAGQVKLVRVFTTFFEDIASLNMVGQDRVATDKPLLEHRNAEFTDAQIEFINSMLS